MKLVAIAAMAKNRAIGLGNRLPWHLPEDFRWFKQCTLGGTLLMGRRTFESIGRPLPGRTTLVLSRSGVSIPAVTVLRSLADLPAAVPAGTERIWVCGGAGIYRLTLPQWSEAMITRVKRTVEGDAFFPEFESQFPAPQVVRDTADFTILHYRR
jgi:dihydrofolate reductase